MRKAKITWSDGTVNHLDENNPIVSPNIASSLSEQGLLIRNLGKPDPTPHSTPRPAPRFVSELWLWTYANEGVPMGAWCGARFFGNERHDGVDLAKWLIIGPTDAKQKLAYPLSNYAEYEPTARFQCLEGGKAIWVPIAKNSDPLGINDHAIDPLDLHRLKGILNVDYELYNRHKTTWDKLFAEILVVNEKSTDASVPPGRRNLGAMINPFLFADRTGIDTDTFADYANVWQFGIREMGVSNRLCFYWYLRAIMIGAIVTGDFTQLQVARLLASFKSAQGFIQSPGHRKDNRWAGEHSFGGVLGDAEAKQFRGDHQLLSSIFPYDQEIANISHACTRGALAAPPWSGSGGARNFGNQINDLFYIWKATGDDRLRQKAAHVIGDCFARIVGSERFFRENAGSNGVSGGEGVGALVGCFRWLRDGNLMDAIIYGSQQPFRNLHPIFESKLISMLDFYLEIGGRWVGGEWQACYFFDATGDRLKYDWGRGVHGNQMGGSQEQGLFWLPLRRFAASWQLDQMQGIEQYVMNRLGTLTGADTPGWGPGITKWLSIAANAILK